MTPPSTVLRLFLPHGSADGMAALTAALPGTVSTPLGLDIPLDERAPEEVLALCIQWGITARATCIFERGRSG
jgi:hypothetical protein